MFDIKDKVVLITGAAAGIGASVVRALLKEQIKSAIILDIKDEDGLALEDELNKIYGGNRVKFIKCDITQERELENAFRTVTNEQGYIDVVINNAGIFNDKAFVKEIEVNLVWDVMRQDESGRGGTIINIASIAAVIPHPVVPVYSATKSAVVKFSTTIGHELHYSRTGIRVLVICFGLTNTQMVEYEQQSFDPVIKEMIRDGLNSLPSQTMEQAAEGLMEVYKNGKSGSVWVVTSGKPAVDVTPQYLQSTQIFNDIIFN